MRREEKEKKKDSLFVVKKKGIVIKSSIVKKRLNITDQLSFKKVISFKGSLQEFTEILKQLTDELQALGYEHIHLYERVSFTAPLAIRGTRIENKQETESRRIKVKKHRAEKKARKQKELDLFNRISDRKEKQDFILYKKLQKQFEQKELEEKKKKEKESRKNVNTKKK